jgi:hypothetical protein
MARPSVGPLATVEHLQDLSRDVVRATAHSAPTESTHRRRRLYLSRSAVLLVCHGAFAVARQRRRHRLPRRRLAGKQLPDRQRRWIGRRGGGRERSRQLSLDGGCDGVGQLPRARMRARAGNAATADVATAAAVAVAVLSHVSDVRRRIVTTTGEHTDGRNDTQVRARASSRVCVCATLSAHTKAAVGCFWLKCFLCVIMRHVLCVGEKGEVECFSTRSESPGRQAGAAELHVPLVEVRQNQKRQERKRPAPVPAAGHCCVG